MGMLDWDDEEHVNGPPRHRERCMSCTQPLDVHYCQPLRMRALLFFWAVGVAMGFVSCGALTGLWRWTSPW